MNYLIQLGENTEAIDLNTVYDYVDRLNTYIYDFFPKKSKLINIDEYKIKEFLNYMFNRKKKNGTGYLSIGSIEKVYSALSWIIRYSSEISEPQLLKENYTKKILFKTLIPKGRGRKPKEKRNKSHSPERLKKLIEVLNEKANIRLKTMGNIILDVGCRDEECLGLKWKNIDFKTNKVSYDEAVTAKITKKNSSKHSGTRVKGLKSKHSYRGNYLSDSTIRCLKNLKTFKKALGLSVKDDDYIFTIWSDNQILSPISFADEYKDFRTKYGFEDITPYDVRHSISNILLESGMSPKDVAQYMGNSARTILESYADIRVETEIEMKNIITDKLRSNRRKTFSIDAISIILNSTGSLEYNKEVFELLDFVANSSIGIEEVPWVIENAKKLILEQYPILENFCSDNPEIVKAKVDTYKMFNKEQIELSQNEIYYRRGVKI